MTFVSSINAARSARKYRTTAQVVAAIVERSGKIRLADGSKTQLALVRDADGRYILTEKLFALEDDALPGRHYVWREDGKSLPHGHVVTFEEATHAVRTLLGLDGPQAA
jgi:hypothetical protein